LSSGLNYLDGAAFILCSLFTHKQFFFNKIKLIFENY
jgi:hypothetical protein